MDMESILQLPKNTLENMTFQWCGNAVFPSVQVSGADLVGLHEDHVWLVRMIGQAFLERRILWEDADYEFKFVSAPSRGIACRVALENCVDALTRTLDELPGHSPGHHLPFVGSLMALKATLSVTARQIVIDLNDYNRRIAESGGSPEAGMTESEHFQLLVDTVRQIRQETYPIWGTLIALLPPGPTKQDATRKFRTGCATVGLDTTDVLVDWTTPEPAAPKEGWLASIIRHFTVSIEPKIL